jgi:CRISPR-associated protein Cas5t
MEHISLKVTVPLCSFRRGTAREFLETERIPPPSTVYGFLLSLVGEWDRYRYSGTKIAIVIVRKPEISRILRTVWRFKDKKKGAGSGNNKTPDYQEVLSGLEFGVWIYQGELAQRVFSTLSKRGIETERSGGLSLGESRDIVDKVDLNPEWMRGTGYWLEKDSAGKICLPVWTDHVGAKRTKTQQFTLIEKPIRCQEEGAPQWITISPQEQE